MFEHLSNIERNKSIRFHFGEHIAMAVTLSAALFSLMFVIVYIAIPRTQSINAIAQGNATIQLMSETDTAKIIVGNADNYPLTKLNLMVKDESVTLRHIYFLLNGAYKKESIKGIRLTIDDVQVGIPRRPNDQAEVHFYLDTVVLQPGQHQLSLNVTTEDALGAVLQLTFFPEASFDIISASGLKAYNVLRPYKSGIVSIVEKGALKAFLLPDDIPFEQTVYIYSKGEEFRLQYMLVRSASLLDGIRIDVFDEDVFLTSAVFLDGQAVLDFSNNFTRIMRSRSQGLRFVLAERQAEQILPSIEIVEISALGLLSNQEVNVLAPLYIF